MISIPEQNLREQLAIVPEDSFLHFKLAKLLTEHQPHEAIAHYQTAIQLKANYPEALRNLAALLFTPKNADQALAHLHTALALDPADLQTLCALGNMLTSAKHADAAIPILRQAIRLAPNEAALHNNLALAFNDLGRFDEAEKSFLTALHLKPTFTSAHNNLGILYITMQRLGEAHSCFDIAAALDPADIKTKCNRALALLHAGDYINGWKEFDNRWLRRETPHRSLPAPLWNGEPLHNKRILLYTDQGLGDRIQFIRYCQLLKAGGACTLVECPTPLAKILNRATAVDKLILEGDPVPQYDFHSDLTRLPLLCKTTLDAIPNTIPYLTAEPDRQTHWHSWLSAHTHPNHLRIGLYWQGNPHHQWDHFRSLPLFAFEPLTLLPNVNLISLQRGPGTEQIEPFQRLTHSAKNLLTPFDGDQSSPDHLADSAALIANLDLIITVDTATAHLAGALAKRTFVLLSTVSDYRWLSNHPDTPWYPTLRLFRQPTLHDWQNPISHITQILHHEALHFPPPTTR